MKDSNATKAMTIRLSDQEHAAIVAVCKRRYMSFNALVRSYFAQLADHDAEEDAANAKRKARLLGQRSTNTLAGTGHTYSATQTQAQTQTQTQTQTQAPHKPFDPADPSTYTMQNDPRPTLIDWRLRDAKWRSDHYRPICEGQYTLEEALAGYHMGYHDIFIEEMDDADAEYVERLRTGGPHWL